MLDTGVYEIRNTFNNKSYIGSTRVGFSVRWRNHLNQLRRNKHINTILQNSYNKYGEDKFKFTILHRIPREYCIKMEQFYLDNSTCEYNISKRANGLNGPLSLEFIISEMNSYSSYRGKYCSEANSMLSIRPSTFFSILNRETYSYIELPESIIKKCLRVKQRVKNTPWRGKKRKESTNIKISKSLKNKYNGFSVIDLNTGNVFPNVSRAAEEYNLHPETLRCYLNGKRVNRTSLKYVDECKSNTHKLNKNGRKEK